MLWFVVLDVPSKQVSKADARGKYRDETPEPDTGAQQATEFRDRGSGRPSKKDRRDLAKWKKSW